GDAAVTARERARGRGAILLHGARVAAEQAPCLARMRRQYPAPSGTRMAREEIQAVGVDDERQIGRERAPPERLAPVVRSQARAEHGDVGDLEQRVEIALVRDAPAHELGPA